MFFSLFKLYFKTKFLTAAISLKMMEENWSKIEQTLCHITFGLSADSLQIKHKLIMNSQR